LARLNMGADFAARQPYLAASRPVAEQYGDIHLRAAQAVLAD